MSAKKITVNGVRIQTESFGSENDPAVLLIHGAGNSMVNWPVDFCEELAGCNRFVIRYDNRDAGQSDHFELGKPGYSLRDMAADAVGILGHYDVRAAHIVGLSQGGAIAQLLAIEHPEMVKTITIISGTPGIPGSEADDLSPMSDAIRKTFGEARPAPDWDDKAAMIDYLVASEKPYGGDLFDEDSARAMAELTMEHTSHVAHQLTNPYLVDAGDPWRSRLGAMKSPALIIHGSKDPFFPPDHAKALEAEIPEASLYLIPGMGHANIPPGEWNEVAARIAKHTS